MDVRKNLRFFLQFSSSTSQQIWCEASFMMENKNTSHDIFSARATATGENYEEETRKNHQLYCVAWGESCKK